MQIDVEAVNQARENWRLSESTRRAHEVAAEFVENHADQVIGVLLNGDVEQVIGLSAAVQAHVEDLVGWSGGEDFVQCSS